MLTTYFLLRLIIPQPLSYSVFTFLKYLCNASFFARHTKASNTIYILRLESFYSNVYFSWSCSLFSSFRVIIKISLLTITKILKNRCSKYPNDFIIKKDILIPYGIKNSIVINVRTKIYYLIIILFITIFKFDFFSK